MRDDDIEIGLGESVHGEYEHYYRHDDLLLPEAGAFLSELASHELIADIDDMAEELNMNRDKAVIRKALNIHGVEISDTDVSTDDETASAIRLPSGEIWDTELLARPVYTDSRLLTQLMATDGLGLSEVVKFLQRELDETVDESDVRQAAIDCGLLDGERSSAKENRGIPHPTEDIRL
ncbi:hypothetical protein [Haloarchaeobius baliensis]|uniref:hypothetical protein n=1 Tax=Haloarchaeobius baliensis TaxID=1670458 RepID=UPI003F8823E8